MEEIQKVIAKACKDLFSIDIAPELTRPDEQFGDYSTNVALQLATKLNKKPHEIAEALAKELKSDLLQKVEVAGPGFINIFLTDDALWLVAETKPTQSLRGKTIVAEYSDPNPFKVLHAGHLYTSVVGDAIANLLEKAGGDVHRVNFGGDVGLHVAKTMWAISNKLNDEHGEYSSLADIPEETRAEWMAEEYVVGSRAYGDDERIDNEIKQLNADIYQIHKNDDRESPLAERYWTCRQWSYDYFDAFYTRIGTKFEKYYPESETIDIGLETVKKHIGRVFAESDGAIVFKGENYGLHTRVFINSEGLPTYEAKDVGLIMLKKQDYNFDESIVITGNEQAQYMEVVLRAVEQFAPELAKATRHLTHGMVKLEGGEKMSSRKGNILRAVDVLDAADVAAKKVSDKADESVVLAAVKYAFLKNRTGGDIIYNPQESVALEGNSGPYLQYAHARARSILAKSKTSNLKLQTSKLEAGERSLLRKIGQYTEVVDLATQELMPHYICTYLYELAQTFNRFYENNHVVGDERESLRVQLVSKYIGVLKEGLGLLGIEAPEKM